MGRGWSAGSQEAANTRAVPLAVWCSWIGRAGVGLAESVAQVLGEALGFILG